LHLAQKKTTARPTVLHPRIYRCLKPILLARLHLLLRGCKPPMDPARVRAPAEAADQSVFGSEAYLWTTSPGLAFIIKRLEKGVELVLVDEEVERLPLGDVMVPV